MKVCFTEDINRRDSGKHKFLNRLSIYFRSKNIKIVKNDADILLHIGRNIKGLKARKIIMRVDGLLFNKAKPYEKMNNKIKKYIDRSNALIYQGYFCQLAYEKFLKINKKSVCIHNGASELEFLPRSRKNYFLAYCNWRPHKRLKNICEGFLKAQEKGLNSKLIIAGRTEQLIKDKNIQYVGWIEQERLKILLSEAIATVHLAWLDWCPNAMVESIVAGCPVIYSDSGGSPEIGRNAGFSIKDVQWDFKPCYHYKPPSLSIDEIARAMISLKKNELNINTNRKDLLINNVGNNYIRFFENILSR